MSDAVANGRFGAAIGSLTRTETVDVVLRRNGGIGPGFDYLRLGLSAMIFIVHIGGIINGARTLDRFAAPTVAASAAIDQAAGFGGWLSAWWSSFRPLRFALSQAFVPMFFALSGFLVTASAFRLRNVKSFLLFRVLRIAPALSGEVLLSAFLLGPYFTTRELSSYFTDPQFFRYFGNILGFVTYELPGVFESNPEPRLINGNLWTLPGEFYCYLILSLGMATGLVYRRNVVTALVAAATVPLLIASIGFGYHDRTAEIVYYFFIGCLFNHWKDRLPINAGLIAASLIASSIGFCYEQAMFITPVFLVYFTVAIGVINWPTIALIKKGDYSYGLYLYGFPICQAVVAGLPGLRDHPVSIRLLAAALTIICAVASWHLLERPTLGLKKRFGAILRVV